MERLQSIFERISLVGAYVGGILLLAASVVIVVEVVVRKAFNFSLTGADEMSGYAYALSMAWGYAYALHRRAHIRVDVVHMLLPFRVRCLLDVLSFLAFAVFASLLTYWGYIALDQTLEVWARADTPLGTPLAYPQVPWLLGLAFLSICAILLLARTLKVFLKGNLALVQEIAHGAPGEDEIAEEIAEAMEQAAREGARAGRD